ncbi:hypothetical protein [Luteolibacter sp. Populi]|uniref:hypothetical protein n=1 Tax=Luteolibacter sp. Populi TaxID=3230487 RepID=UPI0034665A32
MQAGRRYSFLVIGGALLACALFAAVNTFVDPFRVTPVSWRISKLEPYRDFSEQIRTGKAGLVRSGQWQAGLFGSSRVDNAWNPDAAGWQGQRVVNLGASGGFIYETIGIARYFLEREQPELLVIGIDPGDMTNARDTRPLSDYNLSPFAGPDLNREIRYVVGLSTFEASVGTCIRAAQGKLAEHTPHGLRLRPEVANSQSQMEFIRGQLRRELEDSSGPVDPDKAALLRSFLTDCAASNYRVVIIVHPVHALMHAKSKDRANPPPTFESLRRFLLGLTGEMNALRPGGFVSYWDFCNFQPVNCEPLPADKTNKSKGRMQHWNDLGHYDVELGESVLGQALGWPVSHPEWAGHGRKVTPDNIESYLDSIRSGYAAYLNGPGAADVAWKESLLAPQP